jgi:hypothetical protein
MKCPACGAEMRLLKVAPDQTFTAPGYEEHTFECSACHAHVQRRVFIPPALEPITREPMLRRLQVGSEVRSTARPLKVFGHALCERSHE